MDWERLAKSFFLACIAAMILCGLIILLITLKAHFPLAVMPAFVGLVIFSAVVGLTYHYLEPTNPRRQL